ncbi:PKD domain-containing protein [Egicoccus halophilus]|uniref:PKD domain-containing protein n=1 Tax=Egicoccus halophilus TaxID=1670830 RepID=A0A8J3AB86_9ACTN|nr:PKD domain-containing protein [Egicoccus halophilus]GGI07371.1 hypothetical protein GCM10011354_23750 [Egicoccus halophilus]
MAERPPRTGAGERGFTLVELLVVLALALVVGAAVVSSVGAAARAETRALDLRGNTDAARVAAERVRDGVRQAYGVCDVSDADRLVVWTGDTDGDDRIDADELRTYRVTAGRLERQEGVATPIVLAGGLAAGSPFSYFDREGDPLPVPLTGVALDCASTAVVEGRGGVASVGLALAGDRAPDGRTAPVVVDSRITLRNAAQADAVINPNRPPRAQFTQTCTGRQCAFDGRGSFDEDGEVVRHEWDFGDGTATATGDFPPVHVFPNDLPYLVTLTVTDDKGAVDSLTQAVLLDSGAATPAAAFTVVCASDRGCRFDASGSFDADGDISRYDWDLGDGHTASGYELDHQYAASGVYAVTLTVTDAGGRSGSQVHYANPTATPNAFAVAGLTDLSTTDGVKSGWLPIVEIEIRYADGAPAHAVRVEGQFATDTTLRSGFTNAQGRIRLQANGIASGSRTTFTVQRVGTTVPVGTRGIELRK